MKTNNSIITILFVLIFYSLNHSQALFIDSGQKLGESTSWSVSLQDLNGDGIPDACIDGQFWINNGKGFFTKSDKSIGTGSIVTLGDINGDGFIDAVSGSSIYLNDGHWNFIKQNQNFGAGVRGARLLDLNNDGHLDAITYTQNSDRIWYNDGYGHFTDSGISPGGWGQCKYETGDINGDGITDIVVAIPHTAPPELYDYVNDKIWLGDGHGKFTEQTLLSVNFQTRSAIPVDLNGDGSLDMVMAKGYPTGGGDNWSKVYINDGHGNYTDSGQKLNSGYNCAEAKVADLNGDGFPDIFFANGQPGDNGQPNTVWLNDGKGHFTDSGLRLGNSNSLAVALGDIDGDGDVDAVVANVNITTGKAYAQVYFNTTKTKISIPDGSYLGQTCPNDSAVIFAPNIVSIDGRYEYGLSVSPDGNKIFYTADSPGDGLTFIEQVDGKWSKPKTANLRGNNSWEFEAFFTPNGKKIYFTSDTNGLSKFWYIEKDANGWGTAKYLNSPINNTPVMWCSFTSDETIYYGNNNDWKIHRAKLVNGNYPVTENLGFKGNHPTVAPDESFFVFNSNQYGGLGQNDILIVFRKEDGTWTIPINMGDKINTSYSETCASLSPGGEYLFFSRYNEPGDKSNIYWIKVNNIIDSLKASQNLTGIKFNDSSSKFKYFVLNQNFPNPFNPSTNIQYSLAQSSLVKITIYNVLGKKIKRLINNFQYAGEHSVVWNGTDDSNITASSGTYFYKMVAGETTLQKKMILIR